ncbi:MAG: hypothetical protein A2017_19265 [Lentisphaerae bacterium GWF2_44_16]|nr:MAG: hypothetical protein A2017_19265 [Lentisphaerae bacterium GWF2_44_16]
MSGSGSNAEKLLDFVRNNPDCKWKPSVIITDAPEKSRARIIAANYSLPLIELDIVKFYKERGEARVTLMTENGRKIRGEWTEELRELLRPFSVDFGILAGFVPLSNITSDFPCLNIHPGDLTVEKNGRRLLVGLHTIPIETAILDGFSEMRSSVIIAQTYTGAGGEMDSGPILGISSPVKIDLHGKSLNELKAIAAARPAKRPPGGFKDILEDIAKANQEILKENGDWIVFPPAVDDFAAGNFGLDEKSNLFYRENNEWKQVKTVVYGRTSKSMLTGQD